ncbi:iron ABC transporter permease [Clostridium sp. D33t1_170424_F3]|uniref:FecCD family ABC transporter permease n=1 Tax=Clostridium sp. D33t1_170424_F3 TaxID=2787099 RepID=UPI0025712F35|nr:iron ABC transporter permease [Clostridium sp. D33t1_170424_F3]
MKNCMAMKLDTGHRTAARFAALGLLAVFCAASFFLSIGGGAVRISLPEIWRALFLEHSGVQHQIVVNLRLPRALCGAMVGACLAVSGVLLQAVMRNPLASPSVIGVSSGAGFFGMLAMVLFPGNLYAILPPAAFAGGLLTALAIYLLAWRNGINPTRMILAGVATSTFLRAGVDALMVFFPDQLTGFVSFSVGGLGGATWRHAQMLLPYAAAGLVLAVLLSQRLNVLLLGDEAATGLGLHVEWTRLAAIAVAALLAAAAVSVAGLLGFVGLIAPHLIRMLVGSDERYLVPGAALGGAALVMFCDTLGRILAPPIEVPVGIILAVLGAPFFLYLLRGRTKRDVAGKKYFHQLRRKEHP